MSENRGIILGDARYLRARNIPLRSAQVAAYSCAGLSRACGSAGSGSRRTACDPAIFQFILAAAAFRIGSHRTMSAFSSFAR
jgi:hypothetical protein